MMPFSACIFSARIFNCGSSKYGFVLISKHVSHGHLSLLFANEVESHLLVKFFKGVARLKAQRPRYDFIWDPFPAIRYLVSLYSHENLSFEFISRKLATLLALTTVQKLRALGYSTPSKFRYRRLSLVTKDSSKTSNILEGPSLFLSLSSSWRNLTCFL